MFSFPFLLFNHTYKWRDRGFPQCSSQVFLLSAESFFLLNLIKEFGIMLHLKLSILAKDKTILSIWKLTSLKKSLHMVCLSLSSGISHKLTSCPLIQNHVPSLAQSLQLYFNCTSTTNSSLLHGNYTSPSFS